MDAREPFNAMLETSVLFDNIFSFTKYKALINTTLAAIVSAYCTVSLALAHLIYKLRRREMNKEEEVISYILLLEN